MFTLLLLFAAQTRAQASDYCVPNEPTGAQAESLFAGSCHVCMVTDDERTKCWGCNHYAMLGTGDRMNRGEYPNQMGDNLPYTSWKGPIQYATAGLGSSGLWALMADGSVETIGNWHVSTTCAEVATWQEVTGEGSTGTTEAVTVNLGSKVVKQLYGQNYGCIVADDDKYYCWGLNNKGQLGLGHKDNIGDGPNECGDNLVATDLGTGLTVKHAYLSSDRQCVQFTDDRVKCWGQNSYGTLGLGIPDEFVGGEPGQMGDNLAFVDLGSYVPRQIFLMSYSTCMITTDNQAVCWGKGSHGALGLGTTSDENIGDGPNEMGNNLQPVDFGFDRYPVEMSCSTGHCCVILNDDAVVCWGPCWHGGSQCGTTEAGIGDSPDEVGENFVEVDFTGFNTPKKLTIMGQNSCAQFEDLTFACWGRNYYGELGQGTKYPTISRVPLMVDVGAQTAPTCEATAPTTSGGGSPQASVAIRGKTFCYRYLDMATKMADLNRMLQSFKTSDNAESIPMTCVMKQLSKEWPHVPGQAEPNPKFRRPQYRFDIHQGGYTYKQGRRKTPRGHFKKECYGTGSQTEILAGTDSVSTRDDSPWCNPCATIEFGQAVEAGQGSSVSINQMTFALECKVFYGSDNKSKDSTSKCKTPMGLKCRKGSYSLEGNDYPEARSVNHGQMRCVPRDDYDDFKWKSDCPQ